MSHDHCACHSHAPKDYNLAFAIGILLNLSYVIIEVIYGFISNSLSLLADAGHNFNDVLFLILAWFAVWIVTKVGSHKRTYGFKKMTIIAPLVSSIILYISLFYVMLESIGRFFNPVALNGMPIMIVAGIGFLINFGTALFFMRGKDDINIKSVYVHMLSDALVSLGVVVGGLLIMKTGWVMIDPILSLAIIGGIFYANFGILRSSVNLIFDGVPEHVDLKKVGEFLHTFKWVKNYHDLHIWSLSSTEHSLSVHLVVHNRDAIDFVPAMRKRLKEEFNIGHSTIQITYVNCCKDNKNKCN